jgi:hypothetical protein
MVFVAIPDTDALGVVVITSLSDDPPPLTAEKFPKVGDHVVAIVLGHREHGRQITLSLRRSDFERFRECIP